MNLISLLVSINKLSLVAFLITLVFLGYEFFLFKKERRKNFRIKVPSFEIGKKYHHEKKVLVGGEKTIKKANSSLLSLGLIFLLVFGGMTIIGYTNLSSSSSSQKRLTGAPSSKKTRLVSGKGIKIYSLDWRPLSVQELTVMKGKSIIISVDRTEDKNIKMARIRVNSDRWQKENITSNYYPKNNVFYIKYKIKPDDERLKIEAQLFSQVDGWLGE